MFGSVDKLALKSFSFFKKIVKENLFRLTKIMALLNFYSLESEEETVKMELIYLTVFQFISKDRTLSSIITSICFSPNAFISLLHY